MFDVKHFVNGTVQFVHAFLQHSKAAEEVLRDSTRVILIIIGSFSNYDGNSNENVISKHKFVQL